MPLRAGARFTSQKGNAGTSRMRQQIAEAVALAGWAGGASRNRPPRCGERVGEVVADGEEQRDRAQRSIPATAQSAAEQGAEQQTRRRR